MGCHTWDPSKSHGHIFAGPTWAATPGAQKDAHMKPSWVPQAHADWDSTPFWDYYSEPLDLSCLLVILRSQSCD